MYSSQYFWQVKRSETLTITMFTIQEFINQTVYLLVHFAWIEFSLTRGMCYARDYQ